MLSDNGKSSFKYDNPIFNKNVAIIEDAIEYNTKKNVFTSFTSISNELLLVYNNDKNEIVFYDLAIFIILNK